MDKNLSQILDLLRQESGVLSHKVFSALSDLNRSELTLFQMAWDDLSHARRQQVIRALNEQAWTHVEFDYTAILLWTLTDADPIVRRLSIEGLREDDDESLIVLFVRALQTDPDGEVRSAAAKALGRFVLLGEYEEIDDADAARALQALLAAVASKSELVGVRRRAVEAVGFASDRRARLVIEDAFSDEDELMQASALVAMGNSADSHWNKTVREALESHSHAKRLAAVYAAGELEIKATVPRLVSLLGDADLAMQRTAVTSLGVIGGPLARQALQAVFSEGDDALRMLAADALETLDFNSQGLTGAGDEEEPGEDWADEADEADEDDDLGGYGDEDDDQGDDFDEFDLADDDDDDEADDL